MTEEQPKAKCSFCGKDVDNVVLLIASQIEDAFICDDCVVQCVNVASDYFHKHNITDDNYYDQLPKNKRKKIAKENREKRKKENESPTKH